MIELLTAAIESLLARNASCEARNKAGQTALMRACDCGDSTSVKVLLGYGADVSTTDAQGFTPLHHAIWRGNVELATLLLKFGASPLTTAKNGARPVVLAAAEVRRWCVSGCALSLACWR